MDFTQLAITGAFIIIVIATWGAILSIKLSRIIELLESKEVKDEEDYI